jgi:precorrin-2/cobalt-factor-2 C20-methyltransferase
MALAPPLLNLGRATAGSSPGLTLVSVGPGDPELLTVAAVRAIQAAAVVAYPVAREGAAGMAAAIAGPWIGADQRHLPLLFPMVSEAEPRIAAWHSAADALATQVAAGAAVVLLCEGDGSLFASSSYVLLALRQRHPSCPLRLIPGVPAACAAAAAASSAGIAWPLALQNEGLLICPTPEAAPELELLLDQAAASGTVLALLKLGRRWAWVRPLLDDRGLLEGALFAQRVGWPDQLVAPATAMPANEQPYFSLLLIRQGWPEVLP